MELVKAMNDLELIMYCIDVLKIEEAKGLLDTYNRRGRFDNMDSVASLHKLVLTAHKSVEFAINPKSGKRLGGTKPRNILGALRNEVVKKEDGRENNTGQPTPEEQIIMNQYIFNHLFEMYKNDAYMDYSLNGWAKQVGLLDTEDMPTLRYERRISEIHANTSFHRIKSSEVVNNFKKDTIYNRNKQVVDTALKSLKKSGDIDCIKHFNVVSPSDKKRRVEELEYEEIKVARKDLLEELGSSIGQYNYAIGNPSPTKQMKEILESVGLMWAEKFDTKIIYESFEIISVKEQDAHDVTKNDFMEAYWNRLITLTESRQRTYDKKPIEEQTWFWQKFYLYNTLSLMEYMGIDVGGRLLDCEMENAVRAKELSDAFEAWENGDKPVGFGFNAERIDEELEGLF